MFHNSENYVDGLKLKEIGKQIGKSVLAVKAFVDSFPSCFSTTLPYTALPSYYPAMEGIEL